MKRDFESQAERRIMTPEEVAKFVHKSCSWVYKHWQELGGVKLGGSLFFPCEEDLYERLFRREEKGMAVRLRHERSTVSRQPVQNQVRSKRSGGGQKEGGESADPESGAEKIDMGFLELVNRRLDYVQAYNSERHYTDMVYMAKRWVAEWGKKATDEVTPEMIHNFIIKRQRFLPL
jgi:hypothetical protein